MTTRPDTGTSATTVLLAVLVALLCTACGAPTAADAASLPALVDAWQQRSGAPAVVVAVDDGRGQLWVHAAGTTARDGDVAAQPDDRFRVGSITKLWVATVVWQLVEEGRLSLDEPVNRHLDPALHVSPGVTVRDLLGHTSGIPDYARVPGLGAQLLGDRDRAWTTHEVLHLVAGVPADFRPGTAWEYSNTGYVLLGLVIEAVTGESWAQQVRERIIDPLHLAGTEVPSHGTPPASVVPGYHDADGDGHTEDVETGAWPALETTEGPAGAVVSTAADVAVATRAIFDGPLLQPGTVEAMTAPGPAGRRYDGYGLGAEWVRPDRQRLAVGHGGFVPGFRSVTWYVADLDVVVTVLANESRVDPADLAELLLAAIADGTSVPA